MSQGSWDPIWERVFSSQEWGKYPGEDLIRFIARNFYSKDRKNIRILEIGSGPGANIWYMSREGFNVFGIDGSQTAIDNAMKRLKSDGLNATLTVGDIISLPYEDGFFDCVVDMECLYCNNFEKSSLILKEIHRVLKDHGLFYSRTFTDEMHVGPSSPVSLGEYDTVLEGPLAGKGFVRLASKESLYKLYRNYFNITSLDKSDYTLNNGLMKISEWFISCQKIS